MSHALGVALFLATLSSDEFCLKKLDQMLAWYTYYGLPLSSPEADLVLYTTKSRPGNPEAEQNVDDVGLGFTLEDQSRSRFRRIEVRNFVAMELAELLKLDTEPDRDWTTAQWAGLRENVRAKVKDELLKP